MDASQKYQVKASGLSNCKKTNNRWGCFRQILTVALCHLALIFSTNALSATIYKCLDEKDRATFSNTPCPDSVIDGQNEAHKTWRELRGLVKKGSAINRKLGGDQFSIKQCQINVKNYKNELDQMKPTVFELAKDHPRLLSALSSLEECAVCRISAIDNCQRADQHLNKAMNGLMFIK